MAFDIPPFQDGTLHPGLARLLFPLPTYSLFGDMEHYEYIVGIIWSHVK